MAEISNKVSQLGKEDEFLRGMLNNLVNQLNVEDSKKIEFFGNELNRTVTLDNNGGLGEDSSSIINSMILLKQYAKDEQEAKNYFNQSLEKNLKIRDALRFRFLQYYPGLENEI